MNITKTAPKYPRLSYFSVNNWTFISAEKKLKTMAYSYNERKVGWYTENSFKWSLSQLSAWMSRWVSLLDFFSGLNSAPSRDLTKGSRGGQGNRQQVPLVLRANLVIQFWVYICWTLFLQTLWHIEIYHHIDSCVPQAFHILIYIKKTACDFLPVFTLARVAGVGIWQALFLFTSVLSYATHHHFTSLTLSYFFLVLFYCFESRLALLPIRAISLLWQYNLPISSRLFVLVMIV